jgi:hypothetical protein
VAINVPEVTPTQAAQIIELLSPLHASIHLWGSPGVGKTEIVKQLARKRGARLIDVRLSQKIASDLNGLPMIDESTGTTVFARPAWFPTDNTEQTTLFLDELAGADQHTRIAAYGLLLERRIENWHLPGSCQVIAASNHIESGAISADFGTALNDRLIHLMVAPDLSDWISWALENSVHPAIVAYLKSHANRLIADDLAIATGDAVLPSPRSWKRTSDALHLIERDGKQMPRRVREAIIAGIVGAATSFEFWAVYDEVFSMPSVLDVLDAAQTHSPKLMSYLPANVNGLFALGFSLASVMAPANVEAVMRVVLALREATTTVPSGEAMAFVGSLVLETAEKRRLHDQMLLSPSYDRYSDLMRSLRVVA